VLHWSISFGARAADVPVVAAAADLKFALTEVAAALHPGHRAERSRLSFGSSGNFTQQIEQGAPFELFLSADEQFIFRLADRKLTVDRGVLYATGRLVLFAPKARRCPPTAHWRT
jgi:molybdate transport system substrate-binding protein